MNKIKSPDELITQAQTQINCVSVAQAQQLFASADDALVIDVRETDAVINSKLSCSEHISRGLLEMKVGKLCPQADALILTHCAGGGRASLAAHTLQNMGYRNVHAITAKYAEIKAAFG